MYLQHNSEMPVAILSKLRTHMTMYMYKNIILYVLYIYINMDVYVFFVAGRGGLYGCEMLRIPCCLDNRLTDGGKVVSPTHRPHFTPQNLFFLCFRYSFLLEAE
jgi:hypothetical protein